MEDVIIKPRDGVILVRVHKKTNLSADIYINEDEDDRKLITGEVLEGDHIGETAIFGKYATLNLDIKGVVYSFIDVNDIIGYTSYREDI